MSLEAFMPMKYGPIGEAIDKAEPHTEADPVGIHAAILAMWGSAINGLISLEDGRPVAPWTVLVGESALGRKGTALRVARRMVGPAIGGFLDARTEGDVTSGPALVKLMHDLQEETEGTESGTDTRVLILSEEWSAKLRRQRTDPTYSGKFRECWDGTSLRHSTTKGVMVVDKPLVGFHAHITPGEWAEYVKPRDAKGGSYNRLLPVLVEGSKILPYGHREQYPEIEGLEEAYEWVRMRPRRLTLSRDAARRFDHIRVEFLTRLAEMPRDRACYIERTPEQVLRVAATLTAAERQTEVPRDAVEAAWAFVRYSVQSVETLVRESTSETGRPGSKSLPDRIREILRDHGGEAPSSVLLKRLGARTNAEGLKAAVGGMGDVEEIRGETASGRGRRPTLYRLTTNHGETPQDEPAAVPAETPSVRVPQQRNNEPAGEAVADDLVLSGDWL